MNILLSRRLDHIVFVHSHRVEWWLKPGNGQSVGPWTWVNKPKYGWKQSTCSKRSFIFILGNIILYTVYIYNRYCIDILKTLTFFGSVLEAPQWIQPHGKPGLGGLGCPAQHSADHKVRRRWHCFVPAFEQDLECQSQTVWGQILDLFASFGYFLLFIPSYIYIYIIFFSHTHLFKVPN